MSTNDVNSKVKRLHPPHTSVSNVKSTLRDYDDYERERNRMSINPAAPPESDSVYVPYRSQGHVPTSKKKAHRKLGLVVSDAMDGKDELSSGDEFDDPSLAVKEEKKKILFTRCRNNRVNQVEEMFASGVPVSTEDEHGNQCIHIGMQSGSKRMVKLCLRWGADINAQNKQGQTALHYGFAYNYSELFAYLVKKGADQTKLNFFGYSPYDGLRPKSKSDAIDALRQTFPNATNPMLMSIFGGM